jgi:endonuclease/exonuclease/phosphatase family metal-dependent hydrolase
MTHPLFKRSATRTVFLAALLVIGMAFTACSSGPDLGVPDDPEFHITFFEDGNRVQFDLDPVAEIVRATRGGMVTYEIDLRATRGSGPNRPSIRFFGVSQTDDSAEWQSLKFKGILIDERGLYLTTQATFTAKSLQNDVLEAAFDSIYTHDYDHECEYCLDYYKGYCNEANSREGFRRTLRFGDIRLPITTSEYNQNGNGYGNGNGSSSEGSNGSDGSNGSSSSAPPVTGHPPYGGIDAGYSTTHHSWAMPQGPGKRLAPYDRNDRLRIGSFNIQTFGTTKVNRFNTHTALASIATNFDILAIQEVGSNGNPEDATAASVMNSYVKRLNEIVASCANLLAELGIYSHVRGHQYAFVFRTDMVTVDAARLYTIDFGPQKFTYSPLMAKFTTRTGNLEFALMTIHTSPSSRDSNTAEIQSIPAALNEIAAHFNVTKVGALGDFNADNNSYYYPHGVSFTPLATRDNPLLWESWPNWQSWLYGFPIEHWFTVIRNGVKTTISSSNNNYTYDRFQISHAFARHYTGDWGVVPFFEYYSDTRHLWEGTVNTAGTELALSDHWPIWAEFHLSVAD